MACAGHLNITEYYNAIGLIRIYLIKELLRQKGYNKIIMLGLDTFTLQNQKKITTTIANYIQHS